MKQEVRRLSEKWTNMIFGVLRTKRNML